MDAQRSPGQQPQAGTGTGDVPVPLQGLRVVELAHWVAGPAVGGILADWGADVVKVEPPGGDPMRSLFAPPPGSAARHSPSFSMANRGKRSVVVDLGADEGRAALEGLLAVADVFVTNLRPAALERLGLSPADLAERHPDLVPCSVSAYGWQGPDRDEAGYDLAGFFARAGVLHQITVRDQAPAPLMNGMGDLFTAMSAVAGILAALYERPRRGRGRFVEASLLRTGMWAMGAELSLAANGGSPRPVADRTDCPTPLFNVYRAGDGRWFVLVGVEADRHLPAVLAAVGRPDLLGDERFATARAVTRNRRAFIELLDACFAARPLAEWAEVFAAHDVWWGPVQTPADVAADAQAVAAGGWVELAGGAGRSVDSPIRFDGTDRRVVADAPELGADDGSAG
jgi:crotonobetainyl-CoA:carnitine CoA-transferase CaiB-like acyl-CoA transferase